MLNNEHSNINLSSSSHKISIIAKIINAKTYLEIGVRDGATFLNVNIPCKVAVDPFFIFDTKKAGKEGSYFFETTSDSFFEKLQQGHKQHEYLAWCKTPETPVFDIIFIDGLHTFEQSFRDFKNSLQFAHEKTVWLLDDTVPCDPYSAIPDQERSLQIRQQSGITDASWHGDVFKTVFAINDTYPEYAYCTLVGENPQTIIKRGNPASPHPVFPSLDHIKNLTYFDMLDYAWLFNLSIEDEETALQKFISSNTHESIHEDKLWKRLIYKKIYTPKKGILERGLDKFKREGVKGVYTSLRNYLKNM